MLALRIFDVILFLLDGTEISTGDLFVMERINEVKNKPKILCINKIDKMKDEDIENKKIELAERIRRL